MQIKLNIAGMTCVNCANSIEKAALKISGVLSAKADFAASSAKFSVSGDTDSDKIKDKIIVAINNLGFEVVKTPSDLANAAYKQMMQLRNRFILAGVLAVIIMGVEMFLAQSNITNILLLALSSVAIFGAGGAFFTHAFKAVKNGSFDMSVLISLGSLSAFLYSVAIMVFPNIAPQNHLYFGGAAMIITFVLLGKYLEARASLKANEYLRSLLDLSPKTAELILNDGSTKTIRAEELKIGDIISVKAGSQIAIDGEIVSGGAEIDESMLTGESLPKYYKEGDLVSAGTINLNGLILVKALSNAANTRLSAILSLMIEAQKQKMPIARIADRVAGAFVPAVIAISALTFIIWAILGEIGLGAVLAVSVLLISCPCALGLATPIAIIASISAATKNGIIIKNPAALENINKIKYAVLDKTGTITKGAPNIISHNLNSEDLSLARDICAASNHPINKAIAGAFNNHKKIGDIKSVAGMGIIADYGAILLGNEKLLRGYKIDFNRDLEAINGAKNSGNIITLFAINGEYKGFFALSDEPKSGAKEFIGDIKNCGLTPIILSGDSQMAVDVVATELGINEAYGGLMPAQKYEKIKELQKSGAVLFIGDGINDAPSLKAADIGIALGSDIAKNAGDMVLVNEELKTAQNAISVGAQMLKRIKQNLFWAFSYNTIFIPVAAGALYSFGVWLTPMAAAAAMSASSLCVVINSLRPFRLN